MIRLDPEEMEARSKEYKAEAGKAGEIIKKLDTLLKQLQSEWEGDASMAFAERYRDLRPGFVRMEDLINDISESLHLTAKHMAEEDAGIAKAYRS